jgi:ABC-type multidrug transport system ATPase subunit
MTLVLSGVFAPPLNGATVTLGPGLHVVLGTELDGTREIVALVAGLSAPRRGSVRISEKDPRSAPALRRRTGSLLAEESLPPRATVSGALALALRARNDAKKPAQVLEESGLSPWSERRADSLSAAERRRLALALALSLPEPTLLALYEPLAAAGSERERVAELLAERATSGTCVLAVTASPRDASDLGGSVLLLERGRFVRRPEQPLALHLAPGTVPEIRVRSSEARGLAAELAKDAAVTRLIRTEESRSELLVGGPDAELVALAIARASQRAGAPVLALQSVLPALEVVRAASDGLTRAAYEAAQRAAYEAAMRVNPYPALVPPPPAPQAPPAPPAPPGPSTPPTPSAPPEPRQ